MRRCRLTRLSGEPARLGDDRRVACVAALHERERTGDHGDDQRGRYNGEQRAKAARTATLVSQLAVLHRLARVEELALGVAELPLVARQLERRGEPRPAIEVGIVPARVVP